MTSIKVGGRELALIFTIAALDQMETVMGHPINLEDIKDTVIAISKDRKKLVQVLAILANEGKIELGQEPVIDSTWLARHIRPGMLPAVQVAVFEAVTEGMRLETTDGDESEEVDLVLEELKKNPEPGT